jgi:hypothetical protein
MSPTHKEFGVSSSCLQTNYGDNSNERKSGSYWIYVALQIKVSKSRQAGDDCNAGLPKNSIGPAKHAHIHGKGKGSYDAQPYNECVQKLIWSPQVVGHQKQIK